MRDPYRSLMKSLKIQWVAAIMRDKKHVLLIMFATKNTYFKKKYRDKKHVDNFFSPHIHTFSPRGNNKPQIIAITIKVRLSAFMNLRHMRRTGL